MFAPLNKPICTAAEAVADVRDGDTILVGGFGEVGVPLELLEALAERAPRRLTIVSNNCGTGERGLALLFKLNLVGHVCASFPSQPGNHHFKSQYEAGECTLELVPQGTLAQRLWAGASGLGGLLTRTGVGTALAAGQESHTIAGVQYLVATPLRGNVALVRAHRADERGNLVYRRAARNFNPVMAMAAARTIVEVDEIGAAGEIDPDSVHTPGVFVDRIVPTGPAT